MWCGRVSVVCRRAQDTVVAIRRGGDKVVVTSIHPDHFADCTYEVDPAQVHFWRQTICVHQTCHTSSVPG